MALENPTLSLLPALVFVWPSAARPSAPFSLPRLASPTTSGTTLIHQLSSCRTPSGSLHPHQPFPWPGGPRRRSAHAPASTPYPASLMAQKGLPAPSAPHPAIPPAPFACPVAWPASCALLPDTAAVSIIAGMADPPVLLVFTT